LSSITAEGKNYSNAAMFMFKNGLDSITTYYLKSTYYWVKGKGIIKREIETYNSIKTDLPVRNG